MKTRCIKQNGIELIETEEQKKTMSSMQLTQ